MASAWQSLHFFFIFLQFFCWIINTCTQYISLPLFEDSNLNTLNVDSGFFWSHANIDRGISYVLYWCVSVTSDPSPPALWPRWDVWLVRKVHQSHDVLVQTRLILLYLESDIKYNDDVSQSEGRQSGDLPDLKIYKSWVRYLRVVEGHICWHGAPGAHWSRCITNAFNYC